MSGCPVRQRGQSTAEYAVVIGLVVAAVLAMQVYVKRGLQGKIAGAANYFAVQGKGTTKQWEPDYASSDYSVTQDRSSTDKLLSGGGANRASVNETTTRSGSSTTKGIP